MLTCSPMSWDNSGQESRKYAWHWPTVHVAMSWRNSLSSSSRYRIRFSSLRVSDENGCNACNELQHSLNLRLTTSGTRFAAASAAAACAKRRFFVSYGERFLKGKKERKKHCIWKRIPLKGFEETNLTIALKTPKKATYEGLDDGLVSPSSFRLAFLLCVFGVLGSFRVSITRGCCTTAASESATM